MKVWMAIDMSDEYRLPLWVADTPQAMAEKFHTTINNVWSSNSHYKSSGDERKFIAVEIGEGED